MAQDEKVVCYEPQFILVSRRDQTLEPIDMQVVKGTRREQQETRATFRNRTL